VVLQTIVFIYSFDHQIFKPMGRPGHRPLTLTPQNAQELHSEESALWRSFRLGNELAFSSLYKRYVNKFFNYGMHLCHEREIVLDTIQELFTNLWFKRSQLSEVQAVNYYLFKAFRNLLFQKLNLKENSFIHIEDETSLHEPGLTSEESIILEQSNLQQQQHLQVALKGLTKRQREVVLLKFYQEFTYQQVASVMEITVESAHNLISKAIQSLRTKLRELEGER
jgi:RNA polymerase sigma factor (sigma-70 family)